MLEYRSKLEECDQLHQKLNAYRPLESDALEQLRRFYRVSLTYTSNALEGNTLTEAETKVVLEDGITIGGKPMKDHLEAIGHAKAYDYLYALMEKPDFSEADILALHKLVAEGVEASLPGQYRRKPVIITGTEFIPPSPKEVPRLMQAFIGQHLPDWLQNRHPVETAALAHLELVTIHPFMDGNGRTARLMMNLFLMKAGYCTTIIPPVLRPDYISSLSIAQVKGDKQPFLNFVSETVYESLKDMLRLVEALRQ